VQAQLKFQLNKLRFLNVHGYKWLSYIYNHLQRITQSGVGIALGNQRLELGSLRLADSLEEGIALDIQRLVADSRDSRLAAQGKQRLDIQALQLALLVAEAL